MGKAVILTAKKTEINKDREIRKEEKRIREALRDLDENKLAVVDSLIKTAAFTAVSLRILEESVKEKGFTVEYKNGENQYGTKQSDEVKTMIALQKNHTAAIKALADIAPAAKKKTSRFEEIMGARQ